MNLNIKNIYQTRYIVFFVYILLYFFLSHNAIKLKKNLVILVKTGIYNLWISTFVDMTAGYKFLT